jgi:hypothetical protein
LLVVVGGGGGVPQYLHVATQYGVKLNGKYLPVMSHMALQCVRRRRTNTT